MRAIWNGTVLAESDETVVVEGNHYFPPDAVRWDELERSDRRSVCPWKGEARYWSVSGAGRAGEAVGWEYPEPTSAARQIAGHVAFWRGVEIRARPWTDRSGTSRSCAPRSSTAPSSGPPRSRTPRA
ncbi:DUF427 domain-containing protein [Actinotalea sp.]|uniref:DUF427 domain-containing protein n=1 Tax=Actinotalea sp. TaxID=1872145 RepID=UPI0035696400